MLLLVMVGWVFVALGGLWLVIKAFGTSAVWGLLCLLIPGATLVFAILNWSEVKTPFLIQLAGVILIGVGAANAA